MQQKRSYITELIDHVVNYYCINLKRTRAKDEEEILSFSTGTTKNEDEEMKDVASKKEKLPWNWVCFNLLRLLKKYPQGVSEMMISCELQKKWDEESYIYQKGISSSLMTSLKIMLNNRFVEEGKIIEVVVEEMKLNKNKLSSISLLSFFTF